MLINLYLVSDYAKGLNIFGLHFTVKFILAEKKKQLHIC